MNWLEQKIGKLVENELQYPNSMMFIGIWILPLLYYYVWKWSNEIKRFDELR